MYTIHLHPQTHNSKPSDSKLAESSFLSEVAKISSEIGVVSTCRVLLDVQSFSDELEQGKTWSSLFANDTRSKDNWEGQQAFGVDLDNCQGKSLIDILEVSREVLGCLPGVLHKSFSWSEETPKYRLIYFTSEIVRSPKLSLDIQRNLTATLGGDVAVCDLARLFYGCNEGGVVFTSKDTLPIPCEASERGFRATRERRKQADLKKMWNIWGERLKDPLKYFPSGYECIFNIVVWMWEHGVTPEEISDFLERKIVGKPLWSGSKHNTVEGLYKIIERAINWKETS